MPQLTAHIDLLPTLAELCGASTQGTKPLDGVSLASLLLNGDDPNWPEDRQFFSRAVQWWNLKDEKESVVASVAIPYPGSVRTERWRAINEGEGWQLFDMRADPEEKRDVAAAHPGETARLGRAYDNWFADVLQVPVVRPAIDVGHPEWPQVKLTVPEAYFTGTIHWYNRGFAHDWLTDWSNPTDKIWWEVNVVTAGRYQVSLKYACEVDAVGTKLRVSAGDSFLVGAIQKAHQPHPVLRPSRIGRKRFIQTFALQELGEIELEPGRNRIMVEVVQKPGDLVCDVHSLIVTGKDLK